MHKVIKRKRGLAQLDLNELWQYRELLGYMAWRDVVVRYKQTAIGVLWAFIRPLITMVVFTVIFGKIAKLPSGPVPYAVLTFTALLPWQFFATAFADSAQSVIGNGHMVGKIYFPRLILPLSSIAVGAVDFLVSFVILVAMMFAYHVKPPTHIVYLPLFLLLAIVFTLGLGVCLSAMYVKYRDLRHLIPFITQIGLYISPVGFSSAIVPERWRLLYSLNPMVAVIDGFRWSLLGAEPLYLPGVILGSVTSLLLLVGGLFYFKISERHFADLM